MYLCTRNRKVVVVSSSIFAEIAQLVEHNLAKVGVASSSLVFRSKWERQLQAVFFHFAMPETMARTERPQDAPFRGRGCKHKFARNRAREARVRVSFSAQNGKDSFRLSFFILHCRK